MKDENAIAAALLDAEAVKINAEVPFTWTSGLKSPIYCDNRKLLSLPISRDLIKSELCRFIFEEFPEADVIAGVATAGIPWAAMISDQLKMPMVYVRSASKAHGMGSSIEGKIAEKDSTVVIEDLISTGKSSLQACNNLIEAGAIIEGVISIFNYGIPSAAADFNKAGIKVYSLCSYQDLLDSALQRNYISEESTAKLLKWKEDPENWSKFAQI